MFQQLQKILMCVTVSGLGSDVVDIEFNSDGTKLFLVDQGGDDAIEEFDLSTAYDVSTCTNVEEHFAGEFNLVGIEFNPSGTKLFIYDTTGTDKIKQYSLNSPYNLSSLTLQKQSTGTSDKNFQTIESQPMGFTFSSDGSKMFITGIAKDKIQQIIQFKYAF